MLRRNLIKGILGSAFLLCGKIVHIKPSEQSLVNAILGIFTNTSSASNIGRIYLDNNPRENDIAFLTDRIFVGWSERKRYLALSGQATINEILAAQCKQDFHAGRVPSIDGWILSHTELRLFAVAYLAG